MGSWVHFPKRGRPGMEAASFVGSVMKGNVLPYWKIE